MLLPVLSLPRWTALVLALSFASSAVNAAFVWTDRTDFEANRISSGFYFNNFNTDPVGDQLVTSRAYSGGTPTFSFTLSTFGGGSGNDLFVVTPVNGDGRAMSTTVEGAGIGLRLDFTSGNVTAVGANFFLTDLAENRVTGTFDLTLSDGTTVLDVPSTTSGTLPFRGFTTDGSVFITSLVFQPDNLAGDQYATLDNLYVGMATPVPEPAHYGVFAVLFLIVASAGHAWHCRRSLQPVKARAPR